MGTDAVHRLDASYHRLARALSDQARDPQSKPECCRRNGFLWDLGAVYLPGFTWDGALPPAVFCNGPVVKMKERLDTVVSQHQ